MCNAIRDHVGCLLVWNSEQRLSEGKVGKFANFCLFLMLINTLTEERRTFGKYPRLSLNSAISYLIWTEQTNQFVLPSECYCISERHHFRSLLRHYEFSDTNVCSPTAYKCHHSTPRSVTRHMAEWICLVKQSADEKWGELILLFIYLQNITSKICYLYYITSFLCVFYNSSLINPHISQIIYTFFTEVDFEGLSTGMVLLKIF